ncbi:QRFP-like peptide receptor [Saccoglossus kowalevskii]
MDSLNSSESMYQAVNNTVDEYKLSSYTIIITTVFYVIIFILGVIGNVLVLFVVCCNKDMGNSTNYFLVNLSVADLLVLVFCMPVALLETYIIRPWLLGEVMCKLVPFLEYSASQASILTLVAVAIERFVAICYPLKAQYTITPKKTVRICGLIWLIACGASIPYLFMAQHTTYDITENGDELYECGTYNDSLPAEIYVVSCAVIFFLLPLFVLVGLYLRVSLALNKKMPAQCNNRVVFNKKTQEAADEEYSMEIYGGTSHDGDSGNPPEYTPLRVTSRQRAPDPFRAQMKMRKRVVYMLIVVVALFFICLLPQRVVSLWFKYGSAEQQMSLGVEGVYTLVIICRIFTYMNSSINPIIYNIMSTKFRTAFLRALGIKKIRKRQDTTSSHNSSFATTRLNSVQASSMV